MSGEPQTVLVVGADRGIAHAMCGQYRARGDNVIAACLEQSCDLSNDGVRVEPGVDVTDDRAVRQMAESLQADRIKIDVLVHVAGVLGLDSLGEIDMNDVRRQIEINTIGPLRTVQACLPLFAENAKVGIVTSRVGSLNDNTSGGMYAYRVSKAAANMVGLNLHFDLSKRGISVLLLHPGMVATDLTAEFDGDFIQPSEAAEGLIRNMDNLSPANSGKFQHSNGEYLPW